MVREIIIKAEFRSDSPRVKASGVGCLTVASRHHSRRTGVGSSSVSMPDAVGVQQLSVITAQWRFSTHHSGDPSDSRPESFPHYRIVAPVNRSRR